MSLREQDHSLNNSMTGEPSNPLLSLLKSVRSFAERSPSPLPSEEYASSTGPTTLKHHQPRQTDPGIEPAIEAEAGLLLEVRCEMEDQTLEPQKEDCKEDCLKYNMYMRSPAGGYQTPQEEKNHNGDVEMGTSVPNEQGQERNYPTTGGPETAASLNTLALRRGRCRLPSAPLDLPADTLDEHDGGKDASRVPGPQIISLLTDSEDSDNGNDSGDLMITNVTPIRRKRSPPSSPFIPSSCSPTTTTSGSGPECSDLRITHMNSLNPHYCHMHGPIRKHRCGDSGFRTGPWSYTDRMLLAESLQRGVDFITLGMKMRRDVDDVFEKFSDVVAAGLYKSQTSDSGTQTEGGV